MGCHPSPPSSSSLHCASFKVLLEFSQPLVTTRGGHTAQPPKAQADPSHVSCTGHGARTRASSTHTLAPGDAGLSTQASLAQRLALHAAGTWGELSEQEVDGEGGVMGSDRGDERTLPFSAWGSQIWSNSRV